MDEFDDLLKRVSERDGFRDRSDTTRPRGATLSRTDLEGAVEIGTYGRRDRFLASLHPVPPIDSISLQEQRR